MGRWRGGVRQRQPRPLARPTSAYAHRGIVDLRSLRVAAVSGRYGVVLGVYTFVALRPTRGAYTVCRL